MILYKHTIDGGFLAGNTDTGYAAYAYRTSPHADDAKKRPSAVAVSMVSTRPPSSSNSALMESIRERQAKWMAELVETGTPA